MKRLYIAAVLLAAVAVTCTVTHLYQHRQFDRMAESLTRIEEAYRRGDTDTAIRIAEEFSAEYPRISNLISCYVPHGELRESRETAALLPTLLREDSAVEFYMETARLRSQLTYLRQLDDPLLRNIL